MGRSQDRVGDHRARTLDDQSRRGRSRRSTAGEGQVRRDGGGRRAVAENDPELVPELKRLVEPATLGDPMRPLIWVSKSMDKLAAALTAMGHPISADTVARSW